MRIKSFVLSLVLLCSLTPVVVFTPGCAFFSDVAPGNDPVVVNAERAAILSFTLADGFTEWEEANRLIVPSEVTVAADKLRDGFPPAYTSLRDATKAYKYNRSAENKATLDTAVKVAQSLLSSVTSFIPPTVKSAAAAKASTISVPPEVKSLSTKSVSLNLNLIHTPLWNSLQSSR